MAREKNDDKEHDPNLGPTVAAVHIGGESILDRLIPHMKKIAIAAVALTLILGVYFGMRWWKHRKQAQSTNRLALALELGARDIKAEGALPPLPDPEAPALEEEETFPSYGARAEATLAALKKSGQTRGAASLYEAQLLLQANKLDDAMTIYRRVGKGSSTDAAIAREGVGVVLETKAGAAKDPTEHQKLLEEALTAYRAIQPDDKGPRRDYSLYHEARVLEALGKPADAIAALKKAKEVTPDSLLKPLIEQHLATLGAGEGS